MDNNGNDREVFSNTQENLGIDLQPERQIVTARGTGDGLVIRADGRVDPDTLRDAFEEYVKSRKRFLAGNNVSIEWIGQAPDSLLAEQLIAYAEKMDIEISSATVKENRKLQAVSSTPISASSESILSSSANIGSSIGPVSLKTGIEVVKEVPRGILGGVDAAAWDEADCRVIASTVRGGQKIETEHSLVIFGDVNSGAELIAGGDIIVLGTLRGVAHAGAYDETGGGRVIFSLNMQATQLRIGSVISRGTQTATNKPETSRLPEIARVDGAQIVVEPYVAKAMLQRRRD
jgi:septum site-determining protein MinC